MDSQGAKELEHRTIDYLQVSFIEKVEIGKKIVLECTTTVISI